MPKLRLDPEDVEAVLSLVSVYRGESWPRGHFADRERTRLSAFYTVALENCQNALREQRTKPSPRVRGRRIKESLPMLEAK
jgi:hypothetical protein